MLIYSELQNSLRILYICTISTMNKRRYVHKRFTLSCYTCTSLTYALPCWCSVCNVLRKDHMQILFSKNVYTSTSHIGTICKTNISLYITYTLHIKVNHHVAAPLPLYFALQTITFFRYVYRNHTGLYTNMWSRCNIFCCCNIAASPTTAAPNIRVCHPLGQLFQYHTLYS